MAPKTLLLDIETAPNLGYVWGKWEQNVLEYKKEWYILCFCAKWLDGKTITKALPDYAKYTLDPTNDISLVKDIWDLLNEADIICTHNGDAFDLKKINSRFAFHGLPPPKPVKTIDTLKVARKHFAFNSNTLDDLGRHLKLGRKVKTGGFELWLGCLQGDKKAWAKMTAYNKQDVLLLEKVYLKLRVWMGNHPNLNAFTGKKDCPTCGGPLQRRGFGITRTGRYQRYQCRQCGAWSQDSIRTVTGVR